MWSCSWGCRYGAHCVAVWCPDKGGCEGKVAVLLEVQRRCAAVVLLQG